jgi:hypothetical protein
MKKQEKNYGQIYPQQQEGQSSNVFKSEVIDNQCTNFYNGNLSFNTNQEHPISRALGATSSRPGIEFFKFLLL